LGERRGGSGAPSAIQNGIEAPRHGQATESGSFLKKRTKKLLQNLAGPIRTGRSQNDQKFFASFFQKRSLSFIRARPTWAVTGEEAKDFW
jgi:hypothetical protein